MSGTRRYYAFKRYERIWHWSQMVLVLVMMLTGFEIHGVFTLLGFELAVTVHTTAAWALMFLWLTAIFWHITTGEWHHYVPTTKNFVASAYYYAFGIFSGSRHPFHPTEKEKHNPVQRITYLMLGIGLMPAIWVTGLLAYYYNLWPAWLLNRMNFGLVAGIHTLLAFSLLTFLIVHIYMITTGPRLTSQLRAMITGWEEADGEETRG
ncbi:unnamed protein product, partial [marine sediment metagenome]